MNYWKGLLIAVAFDAALIAGCDEVLGPEPVPPASAIAPIAEPASLSNEQLGELDRRIDSLMMAVGEDPTNVDAMEALATLYAENGWDDRAIGPLARALQLDPGRRSLWVALDHAVEKSGRAKITDDELVRAAQEFVEMAESWGHGC